MASRTIIVCGQDWQCGDASCDEVQNDAQDQSVAPFLGPMSLGKPMDALLHGVWQTPELPGAVSSSEIVQTDSKFTMKHPFRSDQDQSLFYFSKYFRLRFANERLLCQ